LLLLGVGDLLHFHDWFGGFTFHVGIIIH
jgi:hypothetical protein